MDGPVATPNLFLELNVTQIEEPLECIYLDSGGPIAAASARGETDFSLSGSEYSTFSRLSDSVESKIRIAVPKTLFVICPHKTRTVKIETTSKLIVSSSRMAAGINGSIVSTFAGSGTLPLVELFGTGGHKAIPLKYSNWKSHTSIVAASSIRLVNGEGECVSIVFVDPPEACVLALGNAEKLLGRYAEGAWAKRVGDGGLKYPLSPTLTKSVASVSCGVNGSGYDLVSDVVEMSCPFSYDTINDLIMQTVDASLSFDDEKIGKFRAETSIPGRKAASWGKTIASSLNIIVNYLVSYRADGRTTIAPDGSQTVSAESWLRQAPRTPMEANDCDGSAIMVASLARAIVGASAESIGLFKYVNAARNVLNPYFTVCVSVLGATSAEATGSSGDGSSGVSVAGHAASLMVDTLSLLRALEKGSSGTVGGATVIKHEMRAQVAQARFGACFSSEMLASMPDEERAELSDWVTASKIESFPTYAIEGTTPASPILYADGEEASKGAKTAERDQRALERVSPNVGRSSKVLYVGGTDDNPHRFYHDFVELTLGRSHPLWSNAAVRSLGCASTQIVLAQEPSSVSGAINTAGATPRDLVRGTYCAVPLVVSDGATAEVLDYASGESALNVIAPRRPNTRLSEFSSSQLVRSLASLQSLESHFKEQESAKTPSTVDDHPIEYVLAFSTIVYNPLGVEHLCQRLKSVSAGGWVDVLEINGLATNHENKSMGKLVYITCTVDLGDLGGLGLTPKSTTQTGRGGRGSAPPSPQTGRGLGGGAPPRPNPDLGEAQVPPNPDLGEAQVRPNPDLDLGVSPSHPDLDLGDSPSPPSHTDLGAAQVQVEVNNTQSPVDFPNPPVLDLDGDLSPSPQSPSC